VPASPGFYIATDLVVHSRQSLAPLAAAVPNAYHPVALSGRPMVRLLILNCISRGSAEADLRGLIKTVSALSGAARQSWQRAGRRLFDVGVQAGNEARPFEAVQLSATTLRAAGALGATIQFTVYRHGAYDAAKPTEQQH
jgi:hypothetical protein